MNTSEFLASIHPSCTGFAMQLQGAHGCSHLRDYAMHVQSRSNVWVMIVTGAPWEWSRWTGVYWQKTSSQQDTAYHTATQEGAYAFQGDSLTRAKIREAYARMNNIMRDRK